MPENNNIVIKKYPNRRLYNTETSCYITLEELSDLIKKDCHIVVIDTKTGEDLTRLTLTQIILEHETKGYNLLPLEFLKQIIKLYDNDIANTFNSYITHSMEYFLSNQSKVQNFFRSFEAGNDMLTNSWARMWEDYSQKSHELMQAFLAGVPNVHNDSNNKKTEE